MDLRNLWWLVPIVGIVSFVLTWVLRRYALARQLLDIPNARSSHTKATPRGGGVAIVLSYLGIVAILSLADSVIRPVAWALLGAGGGIALLGFLDDHGHIAARWRLLGHFAAASWVLVWIGGFPSLDVLGWTLEPGWLGSVVGVLYLVWLLNLYNFMDGIDGIASIETICVALGGALLCWLHDAYFLTVVSLALACAVAGFLCWNFPPARIFMGDAGSGFLGIVLGVLSLQAGWIASHLFWAWVILSGVFITDATITLGHRAFRAEKVYEAHRSHAYQHAARKFGHMPVVLVVLAINLVWLLPVAISVGLGFLDGMTGMVIAYCPLVIIAFRFNAGKN